MPTIIRREHAARQAPFTFQDVERRAEDILSAAREEAQRIVFASKLMIHEETARRALLGSGLGDRGVGAVVAIGPAGGGLLATVDCQHANSSESEFPQHGNQVVILSVVLIDAGVPRDKARVVRCCRQDVADAKVAGFNSFVPRQPLR